MRKVSKSIFNSVIRIVKLRTLFLVTLIVLAALSFVYMKDNVQVGVIILALFLLLSAFYILIIRKSQAIMVEGEQQFRLLTENITELISRHSLDGTFTFISPSCTKILGYMPQELIGINSYNLSHADSHELIREVHNKIIKSNVSHIATYQIRCKDGSYVWLETSSKAICDSITNEPTEILCVSRDVTTKIEEENLFKRLVTFAEELLRTGSAQVSYQKILENLLYISKAKYGVLTLFNENTNKFTTVAIAGMNQYVNKMTKILGFEPIGKEWTDYSTEHKKLLGKISASYSSMSELAAGIMPEIICKPIEKLLNIGEITVTKIIVNNQMIGDFTLIMPAGKRLENDYLIKIYSRQIDMFITRMKAENKLKDSETRLISAQSMAHVGNWELNLNTKIIWASEETFNIYGIKYVSQYLAHNIARETVFYEYRELLEKTLNDLIAKKGLYDVKFKINNFETGDERFIHSRAILLVDENGKPNKVVGTIQDITDYTKAEDEIRYLSYHDQLTGLYNRRFYQEELIRLDTKSNLPITIVMGDVNGLKLINDSFGHSMGDELLKKVAQVLIKGFRENDIIARLGGDEFVILLPKTEATEAEQLIKHVKDMASKENVRSVDISVSYGYETKNDENAGIQEILKKAEDRMYKNKLFESPSMRGKTIKAIINTLHEKNKREEQHSHRVSLLCRKMGEALDMTAHEIEELKSVGLLHDIGKIAIEENILNKQEKLTCDEWEEIKRHPEIGYRILSTVNELSEMSEYVLYHHERWDGTGYPKGLKREEIPLQSRIITIADAYDAMTSERSYHRAMSKEISVEELRRNAGSQFDPGLVSIFIEKVLGKIN